MQLADCFTRIRLENCQTNPPSTNFGNLTHHFTYFRMKCIESCIWGYVLKIFEKFRVLTRLKLPIYSRYKLQREEHRRGTSVASLLDELKRIAKDSRSQSCLPRPSRTLPNPEPPSCCDWPIFSLVHWTKSCLPVPSLSYSNSKVTSTSDL